MYFLLDQILIILFVLLDLDIVFFNQQMGIMIVYGIFRHTEQVRLKRIEPGNRFTITPYLIKYVLCYILRFKIVFKQATQKY